MKKFLLFIIICGVAAYIYFEYTDAGHDAVYESETYDINDTVDPNDEEAYKLYAVTDEDE